MTRQEIFEKLNVVFSDVMEEPITLTEETTARDIAQWASLTHIALISEVEDAFDLTFSMKDVLRLKNVGEMVDLIEKSL